MEETPFLSCLLGRPHEGLRAPRDCTGFYVPTRLHFFFFLLLLLIQARSGWGRAEGSYNEVPENEEKNDIFLFERRIPQRSGV